ncbi:PLP-dependent aminotransferase family protein [Desulfomicrobium baculatum]|uniref:Putative transcriptional regulator, GntR family n=1 Tax=Desulfomicrobium baculatum (strain DSM 4028 / VKM B-1378 / X) TaxID=525897 RepID=C7LW94_DESBD|nr:PLP-dependent aminotransferase family protein [Desulfomicrobium baculatum]ACU91130.1 putative transcriptional regulator, GntR family [Desulfomicrobium baculatum DSM 4028]
MSFRFTNRIQNTPKSFIREILKVTQDPSIISFAGGLPNPHLFPIEALQDAARETLATSGARALQYSTTEGHAELRGWIAARYAKRGITVDPDQVLITTGSQQCLDLLGKLFIEKNDEVILERPSYLGTIQAFTMFEPRFVTVDLEEDGPNLEQVKVLLATGRPKLFYAVPNFQNPSGLTYSRAKREELGRLLQKYPETIFIEDDPYGELRFSGEHHQPVFAHTGGRSIMLGSFSKITVPGFRLGWMVAPPEIIRLAVKAKQAADLHSSTFNQFVINEYLKKHSIDDHIAKITECYGSQATAMVTTLEREAPEGVTFTRPEGGMFSWVTLPEGKGSCMDLFNLAIGQKVAFVPGMPFYTDGGGQNTLRLNFSNASEQTIDEGITRLCRCMKDFLK